MDDVVDGTTLLGMKIQRRNSPHAIYIPPLLPRSREQRTDTTIRQLSSRDMSDAYILLVVSL